ncbi:unnamed protein product (macronuclear) [Paramecium tetraurelia]|uniref:Uncharacterized protein n=1 Tax=Paramecium tetraurelia TaxID=5888 RepID=A0CH32_PARTE|nr:uncharacterized protein GSPATT00007539001 [Paramecium tetraurelia]CAK70099.1 unnamed protein product [Paramecium tetraurelia]|eukprot:XP_001437496.1 hypothetical protein (macronuclear) [Paramecium tetraurelia strain d4-2]
MSSSHKEIDLLPNLNNYKKTLAQNRRTLQESTVQRENDHETFEAQVVEHNDAIGAIDECLQLLSTIATPSLAQIKKVQKNLTKIQNSLKKHNQFQIFVKVLLEITVESNFADQGALRDIIVAFNNLRVELVDSLNQITADEAQAVTDFNAQVVQLNQEHAEFQRAVVVKNAEIEANATKIEQTLDLIDELDADLATLNGQLQAENDDFAFATDVYNSTVAEYNKEINAANQALELLTLTKILRLCQIITQRSMIYSIISFKSYHPFQQIFIFSILLDLHNLK